MENLEVRKMKINDFEEVHKLVNQVYMLHLKNRGDIYINENPLYKKDFINFLNNPKCICYVAVSNDKVLGEIMATVKEINEGGIFRNRKILFIEDICVDKNYTRQGIGTMLYEKIKECALSDDITSIELNVWAFNHDAIQFYNKLGLNCKSMRFENKLK